MTPVGVEDGIDITGRWQIGGGVIGEADEHHEILGRTGGEMPKVVVGVVVVVDVVVVLVAAALEATVSSPQTFCWNSISDDPAQNHALY